MSASMGGRPCERNGGGEGSGRSTVHLPTEKTGSLGSQSFIVMAGKQKVSGKGVGNSVELMIRPKSQGTQVAHCPDSKREAAKDCTDVV